MSYLHVRIYLHTRSVGIGAKTRHVIDKFGFVICPTGEIMSMKIHPNDNASPGSQPPHMAWSSQVHSKQPKEQTSENYGANMGSLKALSNRLAFVTGGNPILPTHFPHKPNLLASVQIPKLVITRWFMRNPVPIGILNHLLTPLKNAFSMPIWFLKSCIHTEQRNNTFHPQTHEGSQDLWA